MKRFWRLGQLVLVAVLALFAALSFSACDGNETDKALFVFHDGNGVIGTIEIEIEGFETVADAVTSEKYRTVLDASCTDWGGDFGLAVDEIYGIVPDSSNPDVIEYISVYHTLSEYASIEEWAEDVTLDGVVYFASDVGISNLPLLKGEAYLFMLMSY